MNNSKLPNSEIADIREVMTPEPLRFPRILVLMVLFSFLSVAAVVFTPAFPELFKEFHLSDDQAQWVMTLFLLGTAFGRLPYGPIANRIGRKKTLYLGLWISILGTLTIFFANSYLLLCLGRLIQALGASVSLKIGYTMIGDLHAGAAATKVLSYSMLAYAILPGIATSISGFLTASFGWRGGFFAFLVFNLFVILSCVCLPETLKKKDLESLKMKKIAIGYANQFKGPSLVLWATLMGLSTAVIFIFAQEAPFIAIERIGLTPREYGAMYLIPAFGIAGGSLLTAWLSDRISSMTGMLIGILVILSGSFAMGIFFIDNWVSGLALFLPQVVIQFGDALLYTNASSTALTEAKDKSNASAVMLFINSLVALVGTFLIGTLAPKTPMAVPMSSLFIALIMLSIWLLLRFTLKRDGVR
jgi:MFS family permease